ncbi:MAG: hypothetical protein HWN68_11860 [Desulfobacterales bacterium]|nr:hypothetical protein [Desulfobacterales bacterium]
MEYESEFLDQLPILGTGRREVIRDGDIVNIVVTVERMYTMTGVEGETAVVSCLLEGRRVFLLLGDTDLITRLWLALDRRPKTLRLYEHPTDPGRIEVQVM